MSMNLRRVLTSILLSVISSGSVAGHYSLSVQPVLPRDQIWQNYQPLARYLSDATGHTFSIRTYRNFLTYWARMQKAEDMHFILDAAHFTDYRIQRKNYMVLAKIPHTVSFTVVTGEENFIFDMDELISRRVATMAAPGMGAVRLSGMYPNPVRLPFFIEASDSVDAVQRVLDGNVDAAIIPSPLVGNYENLNSVVSTEPVPHMAMSVSPKVPNEVAVAVKQALLQATNTPAGKKMLEGMKIEYFEDANDDIYAGYAELLEGIFGY